MLDRLRVDDRAEAGVVPVLAQGDLDQPGVGEVRRQLGEVRIGAVLGLGRIGLGFLQLQLEALVFLVQALYECAIAIATAGLQFCAQCFALLLAGGQALFEGAVYDKQTGQLLSGSFMDYTMPRADNFPSFKLGYKVTPCPHNPLGVKGCGEAGAIGSPPAVINAICHALGIKDVPMPATPYTVWKAVQAAR